MLLPHVRQAFDMTQRLRGSSAVDRSFTAALDWLADGVVLLRADGRVLHANETFLAIARRGDGIRTRRGMMEIADAAGRAQFANAIGKSKKPCQVGRGRVTTSPCRGEAGARPTSFRCARWSRTGRARRQTRAPTSSSSCTIRCSATRLPRACCATCSA